jgi:hypothetical protein
MHKIARRRGGSQAASPQRGCSDPAGQPHPGQPGGIRKENPLRLAHADPHPPDAADYARFHDAFNRVSLDAPWIEVDTTDGYRPGLADIVSFINGQP